ncbi:MFS transporter [Paraurantiacibacter namhicola]|uniref:Putative MFS-type transporter YcaD n=1 Tax=Paraurantiacibacter namhicola TaxID=645517 RepID=A0A1C7D559_9SPHN|nr:MFS transporter [Paraurantiacibacter namhicola]ANU06461.1 putative MFS-type transporter YcaD [Paraurantiacibacter namhicola]
MTRIFLALGSLFVSSAILLAGGALQNTLISIRASMEGFALQSIGIVMAGYYAGFILGCVMTPEMVRRVGHIRVFAALSALAAASSLIFAIEASAWLWTGLRVVVGFSFAGLYMLIESWINERSTNSNRGQVLAIYRIIDFAAMTVGQYLLLLADPAGFILFSLVAVLIALAIVPVALTRIEHPSPPREAKLNLRRLWAVSPLAVAGCFVVGLTNGAFWSIGPIYVQQMGYGSAMIATFMSAAILAGAAAQYPLGLMSDVIDRRKILILASTGAAIAGAALMVLGTRSDFAMLAGAGGYGIFAMALFGLAAAHANDHAEPDDFVAISGGLLLIYGLGSVAGPLLSPSIMTAFGPSALFGYTAAMHAALVVFGLYRIARRRSVPASEQDGFIIARPTTPAVFEFDPRSGD